MSAPMMSAVWGLELPAAKLLVLLALADHASADGDNVYPSMQLIAWKTGYSERQVQRIVKALVKDNILQVVELRPGKTTKYRIDILSGVKKSPLNLRQNATPDIIVSPPPLTSDVTPTPDIIVSPEPSLEPSLEPKEKDKSVLPVVDTPEDPNAKVSSEKQAEAWNTFEALVAKFDGNSKQKPFTDAELQAQVAIIQAKYGNKPVEVQP